MRFKNLSAIVLLFSFVTFSQGVTVPVEVTNSFANLYPSVVAVEWDKEGKNEFEASFKDNGNNVTVTFEGNGTVLETETSITANELPQSVENYIAVNYSEFRITEAAKLSDANGTITYEAEITKDKVKHDLMFDKDGNFLKKKDSGNEKKEDKEEEDKD
jgi:hypothetical protein